MNATAGRFDHIIHGDCPLEFIGYRLKHGVIEVILNYEPESGFYYPLEKIVQEESMLRRVGDESSKQIHELHACRQSVLRSRPASSGA